MATFCGVVAKVREERVVKDGMHVVRCAARQRKGDDFYFDALLFGGAADVVSKYVPVGGVMYITGDLEVSEYEGKQQLSVSVRSVELVRGNKKDTPSSQDRKRSSSPKQDTNTPPLEDDDIPF